MIARMDAPNLAKRDDETWPEFAKRCQAEIEGVQMEDNRRKSNEFFQKLEEMDKLKLAHKDGQVVTVPKNAKPACCAICGVKKFGDQLTISEAGLCGFCEAEARNSLRRKLNSFLSDSGNFSRAEWMIIFDLKEKILGF